MLKDSGMQSVILIQTELYLIEYDTKRYSGYVYF